MTEYDFNLCLQWASAWCVKHREQWRIMYGGITPVVGCESCWQEWLVEHGLTPTAPASEASGETKVGAHERSPERESSKAD